MSEKPVRTICLHGPESVGKSALAQALGQELGARMVREYGRDYCLAHSTDLSMDQLVHIAQVQTEWIATIRRRAQRWLVADTDALMTAVWADMMHGRRDPWFDSFSETADLYLLLDIDLPFADDGLRIFGAPEQRRRFFELCQAELERRGVNWALVRGSGEARLQSALAAIRAFFRTEA